MIRFEYLLKRAIRSLSQYTENDTATRQTAVRWFNRLYYDLAKWNEDFIKVLQDYPGLNSKPKQKDLKKYRNQFEKCYRNNKNICARIDFLESRLDKDFSVLKEERPRDFLVLKKAVGLVKILPADFHELSSSIDATIQDFSKTLIVNGRSLDGRWIPPYFRAQRVIEARKAIEVYIKESDRILKDIYDEAYKVGVLLLSITEYDIALQHDGSSNPQLYIIGEVTMSGDTFNVDNRGGVFNAKSSLANVNQAISTANSISEDDQAVLTSLLTELEAALIPVIKKSPEEAERIITQVQTTILELSRPKPDGGFLKKTSQSLRHAAKAFRKITPSLLFTIDKIIDLISKYF